MIIARDITERQRAERRIARVSNLYAALSQTNAAIIRISDRRALFQEVCRIAVDCAQFVMAAVVMEDPETRRLNVVASHGSRQDYIQKAYISTDSDEPAGRGPAGTAIREGRYLVCQDIANDAMTKPWRDALLQAGFRSTATFPLRNQGAVIGGLILFAGEEQLFDQQMIDLLSEMSSNISFALIREVDTIARLGGDEYTLILEEITEVAQVDAVAEKILSALPEPLILEGREIFVSASIGITIYPRDAQDIEDLVKRADVAMYQAKHEGRNTYVFYSGGLQMPSSERLELEGTLRRALKQEEFVLYYQPKIEFGTGLIVGAEALIRWNSKSRGLVPPNQFISLAEETGLIIEIGEWVLRTACRQLETWREQGFAEFTMAVNLSPRQLKHKNILEVISSALTDTGLQPNLLELEITEGMLMQKGMDDLLNRLIGTGVQLSIDDFGTGYANLAYLKRFRVHSLKIDKSFVDGIQTSAEDAAIVTAIIGMAKGLGIKLIAEGVESKQQAQFLDRLGCELGQGYYFGRPVPADIFAESYIQNRHNRTAKKVWQD